MPGKGCPKCGNKRFKANFKYHGTAVVNEYGEWEKDISVDDSDFFGPYECMQCGHVLKNLPPE
jgi:hypothetical protein